jgi:hypothetical protein
MFGRQSYRALACRRTRRLIKWGKIAWIGATGTLATHNIAAQGTYATTQIRIWPPG